MHTRSKPISVGNPDAPRRVLIIHGYTGSPDEFQELAAVLAERLDAYVEVPLLPGHGTTEEDLVTYSLDDFLNVVETHVQKVAQAGKPFALVGHSLGAHFALCAAAKYPPQAAVATVMPYSLRPPFSIPGMDLYARTKQFWDKPLSPQELGERKNHFYYKRMPGIALGFLKEANQRLKKIAFQLKFPILTINNSEDPVSYRESGENFLQDSGKNPHNRHIILDKKEHGLFYGPSRDKVITLIAEFLEKQML